MHQNNSWLIGLICTIGLTSSLEMRSQDAHFIGIRLYSEHTVSQPFSGKEFSPIVHPGIALHYSKETRTDGAYRFRHSIELGYFHHQDVYQVIHLGWKPSFHLILGNLLELHLTPGISYAHVLSTRPEYVLADGAYQAKYNSGRPAVMPSLGIGFGIDLTRFDIPLVIYLRQEYAMIGPGARRLPISLNSMTGVGLQYQIQ